MEKFRWCFIGTGKLAHTVAQQLRESGRHEVVTCYTRRKESAEQFAAEFGCRACDTLEEAVTDERVDGVYVVTTHNAHLRHAKRALELGKPVLCEKALTVNAADAEELFRTAAERKLYFCEAMWTWFGAPAAQVRTWLQEGAIGTVRSASFTYCMKTENPRVYDPHRAGGALLDITIYPITYSYRLWGLPEKMEAVGRLENGIDWGENIRMTFPGGIDVDITAAIDAAEYDEKLVIRGDEGEILMPLYHFTDEATLKRGGETLKFKDTVPPCSYLPEFDTVAAEIRAGRLTSEKVPPQATLDVMRLLDELRAQMGLVYDELE